MATEAKILKAKKLFESGVILTVYEAFKQGLGTELRSIVCKLKKIYGLPIVSKRVPGESYHKYYLAND